MTTMLSGFILQILVFSLLLFISLFFCTMFSETPRLSLRDTYPVFVYSTTQPFLWVYSYNHIINVPEPQLQFHSNSLCICPWTFSRNTIQFLTFYVAYNFILFPQELALLLEFWCLSFLPLLFFCFGWRFWHNIFDNQSMFPQPTFLVLYSQ